MKKVSTLGFGIFLSVASFANFAPSRLTVLAEGNADIKVSIDGSRFDQSSANNNFVFDNLQPGYHSVNIYQLTNNRFSIFGRSNNYHLLYTTTVTTRPLFATTIQLNGLAGRR